MLETRRDESLIDWLCDMLIHYAGYDTTFLCILWLASMVHLCRYKRTSTLPLYLSLLSFDWGEQLTQIPRIQLLTPTIVSSLTSPLRYIQYSLLSFDWVSSLTSPLSRTSTGYGPCPSLKLRIKKSLYIQASITPSALVLFCRGLRPRALCMPWSLKETSYEQLWRSVATQKQL